METLYIKSGKKYKRIGTTADVSYNYDGLWLLTSHSYSKEFNNILIRLADLPSPIDMQKFIKAFVLKDTVCNALKELEEKNISNHEKAEYITKAIYNYSIKEDKKGKK